VSPQQAKEFFEELHGFPEIISAYAGGVPAH
jgi:hypothetical protein